MNNNARAMNDPEDLEALFDSIVEANAGGVQNTGQSQAKAAPHDAANCPAEKVICRIGQMTRALHDSLRELGYDKLLEKAASAIPDARDRLNYVAVMTEQAAERVLNATEVAKPIQERLEEQAVELASRWDSLFERKLGVEEFKRLAAETRVYLKDLPNHTRATNEQLLEIMMAQDFQDLTGQVIKRIIELAQGIESQLLELLLENVPAEARGEAGLVNGPVINTAARSDVVTSQNQVDELLESLGF